jgi:hypothetical protein
MMVKQPIVETVPLDRGLVGMFLMVLVNWSLKAKIKLATMAGSLIVG